MFIYLLIASELAILYTVFWYLYLRQPRQSRRIVGSTWGSYYPAATSNSGEAQALSYELSASGAPCYMESAPVSGQRNYVKPFMLPVCDEMVLDLKANRYVPVAKSGKPSWFKFLSRMDDCLSVFNVRA